MLVKKDREFIRSYFEDVSNLKGGHASEVVFPENIEELSRILKEADLRKIPVTVSGGGTGTTGARIPFGGIVVSMEKFNRILDVSEERKYARLEAGVTVEDLKDACDKKGLFYTSHPTERSAFVGGTVATNASGSRSFKYGPTRKFINYLKMVLPGGDIFEVRRGSNRITKESSKLVLQSGREINIPFPGYRMPSTKNAAGYYFADGMDLIDLFIGQEGTLSVIVELGLDLVKKPDRIFSCFVFFKKEEDSWAFAEELRKGSAADPAKGALSVEYFNSDALKFLREKSANVPYSANAAIFFEVETGEGQEAAVADRWLGAMTRNNASLDDTWVAMTEKDAREFTGLRYVIPESVNEIVKRSGYQKLSTDIAVPDDKFHEMMKFYKEIFSRGRIESVIFGHIGECHVHTNLLPKSEKELELAKDMVLALIEKGISLGGTVSAEHGVGKTKHRYLEMMYGLDGVLDMAKVKKAFDPNCILNLDNIFPRDMLKLVD